MFCIQQKTQTDNPFKEITGSLKNTIITGIALSVITVAMIAISAWANVQVATVFGAQAIATHSIYTIFLPLIIAGCAVRALVWLISMYHPSTPVTSEVPGRIIAYHIKVGDAVKIGQPLYTLEMMKMYCEINAKIEGTVTAIDVEAGAIVEHAQQILRIDTPAA